MCRPTVKRMLSVGKKIKRLQTRNFFVKAHTKIDINTQDAPLEFLRQVSLSRVQFISS